MVKFIYVSSIESFVLRQPRLGRASGGARLSSNMDGNVQRRSSRDRSSSLIMSPTNDHDNWDTLSLTSTVDSQEPEDTEFVVEGVHAEKEQLNDDGEIETKFLVEWANFPLDQCTWEPQENLPQELRDQWEQKKATEDPRIAVEFEKRWEAAYNEKREQSRHRHRQRNAKRRTLGLPTTSFYFRGQEQFDSDDEADLVQEVPDSDNEPLYDSSDAESKEAEEDNAIDHKATAALVSSSKASSKSKSLKEPRPPNKTFTFQAIDTSAAAGKKTVNKKGKHSTLPHHTNTGMDSGSSKEEKRIKSSKLVNRDRELPSATGYLGSARKPNTVGMKPKIQTSGAISTRPVEVNAKAASVRPTASRPVNHDATSGPSPAAESASAITSQSTGTRFTGKKSSLKKTAKTPVNIFNEGKKKGTRLGIGTKELDKGQKPVLFKNVNQRHKSQLRSRDRVDQGPSIENIPATLLYAPGSNIITGQPSQQRKASKDVNDSSKSGPPEVADNPQAERSPTMLPPQVARSSSMVDIHTEPVHLVPSLKRSSLSSYSVRPNKKPKHVRFTEEEHAQSTSQEASSFQHISSLEGEHFPSKEEQSRKTIDDGDLFASEPMEIDNIADSSTHESKQDQKWRKKVKLSTSPARILDVNFNSSYTSIVSDTDQQWLQDFLGIECLDIGHMFLAESFMDQLKTLESQEFRLLSWGSITSNDTYESLEVVANHLKVGSSGLFVARPCFNLVVFSTKCAEFEKLSTFGVGATNTGNVALKYFMFSSANPIFQLIRPSSSTVDGLHSTVCREKVLLFPTILGVQFSSLVASADKTKAKKRSHFYLAFPMRALDWQRSIGSWLSTRDPSCKLYTNFDTGSWLAFHDAAKRERGFVIIHEALVPFIRRFRRLHKVLIRTSMVIWKFSEALGSEPPRSLVDLDIVPAISTRFSRIFPHGHAILLTPSFLLSEPQAAYRLLKWFFTDRVKSPTNKLVVAYNIVDHLRKLSGAKMALKAQLKNTLWQNQHNKPLEIADDQNQAALTSDDMAARQKLWWDMDNWLSRHSDCDVPYSDTSPVIFADRSIDPLDEQSLVNWFGSWSIVHCQDFRKFYVVGSSSKQPNGTVHKLTSRLACRVEVPKYSRSTVNDPDAALWKTLQEQAGFQSLCFKNEENRIRPWLSEQANHLAHSMPTAMLYSNAVSWVDEGMASHLGDAATQFATFARWWESIPPWKNTHKNTHISFFYTIADAWRPKSFPRGVTPRRTPWIVIFRPCGVNVKTDWYSHGRTELIIWDVRAGNEYENKTQWMQLHELTWMQRALIRYVQMHAHEKNPNGHIHKVWLGGFKAQQSDFDLSSTLPTDLTAEFLLRVIDNFMRTLPAQPYHMKERFYRGVYVTPEILQSNAYVEEQGTEHDDDDGPDTRIIIHPPRAGENLQTESKSKCTNDLFEEASVARANNKPDMVYTYPPTMTWYGKWMEEGRQFEHIMIDEWEKVFQEIGLNKTPQSALTQASSRRGSASSNHSSSTR